MKYLIRSICLPFMLIVGIIIGFSMLIKFSYGFIKDGLIVFYDNEELPDDYKHQLYKPGMTSSKN